MIYKILRHVDFNLKRVVGIQKTTLDQSAKFEIKDISEYLRLNNFRGEEKIIKRIIHNTDPDDVFYDIGANIGTHSCLVGKVCRNVIAFEPHPENILQLQENLRMNSINSEIVNIALSNENKILKLNTTGNEAGVGTHSLVGSGSGINVCTDLMDNVTTQNHIPEPDVVKIDVEGAELMVLGGMENSLSSVKYILIEIHENVDKKDLSKKLKDEGFSTNYIKTDRQEIHLEGKR